MTGGFGSGVLELIRGGAPGRPGLPRRRRFGSSASRATGSSTTAPWRTCGACSASTCPGSPSRSARRSPPCGRHRAACRRHAAGWGLAGRRRRPAPGEVPGADRLCHDRRMSRPPRPDACGSTSSSSSAAWSRRARVPRRSSWPGKVRVGEGDAARARPEARRPRGPPDASVAVAGGRESYVSRGGHKLAAALDAFAIDPAGLVCLDVGASTGGFTDVLLQRGRGARLRSRRGARTARRVAAPRSAGRLDGADQRPDADAGHAPGAGRPGRRSTSRSSRSGSSSGRFDPSCAPARPDRRPGQAPVRGRPGGRRTRRRARPAIHRRVLARDRRSGPRRSGSGRAT